jgi:NTP pyrophosphatase (non-canonical NTP hydrolase)
MDEQVRPRLKQLVGAVRALQVTAPVDDDFPEVLHRVDSLLRVLKPFLADCHPVDDELVISPISDLQAEVNLLNALTRFRSFQPNDPGWRAWWDRVHAILTILDEKKGSSDNPVSLTDWCRAALDVAVEKGWHRDGLPPIPEQLALIHSEVSEALEEYRHDRMTIWYENQINDSVPTGGLRGPPKPEGFPAELADILIRVFHLAGARNIDLEAAVREKHAYNKTRPYRHGNKKA